MISMVRNNLEEKIFVLGYIIITIKSCICMFFPLLQMEKKGWIIILVWFKKSKYDFV